MAKSKQCDFIFYSTISVQIASDNFLSIAALLASIVCVLARHRDGRLGMGL